jgi:hypothetical protein
MCLRMLAPALKIDTPDQAPAAYPNENRNFPAPKAPPLRTNLKKPAAAPVRKPPAKPAAAKGIAFARRPG